MGEQGGNIKIRDLDVNQFKASIQEAIEEKLEESLGDPDLGLLLQEQAKERLERSPAARGRTMESLTF